MTTTPVAAWLELASNTISGGTISIGASLTAANDGVYNVVIVNSVYGQTDKTETFTLTIIDPCRLAVFEINPTPFLDMVVDPTSKSQILVPIKVYTDKERVSSAVVCAIKATFTTSWVPVTVVEPWQKYVINPSAISLPIDYGSHAVTIKIESLNYPAMVASKSFNFNLTVMCTMSAFAIATVVGDFSYIINSGPVTKGPFKAVMIPNCKWPVTYAVAQFQDNVLIGNPTNFNTATGEYTFSFTDPALIGTT